MKKVIKLNIQTDRYSFRSSTSVDILKLLNITKDKSDC